MVLAFGKEEDAVIDELYARGIKNGIKGMDILSGTEARRLESNLSDKVTKAAACYKRGNNMPLCADYCRRGQRYWITVRSFAQIMRLRRL